MSQCKLLIEEMQFDALWLNAMIRIYNGKILKFIDNGIELTPDELWIKNQKIVYIGPAQNESPDFEKTINLEGNILMPGFSNAHTHSLMILFRSMFNRKPLFEWLKCVSPLEKMITQEDAYVIAKFAIMNYLMNGVTSTFDMCPMRYVETYINANIDSGFRTSVCCAISLNSRKRLDSVESLYCRYNNFNPLIRYLLGFHSIYNTDEDILKRIAELGESIEHQYLCIIQRLQMKSDILMKSMACRRLGFLITLVYSNSEEVVFIAHIYLQKIWIFFLEKSSILL